MAVALLTATLGDTKNRPGAQDLVRFGPNKDTVQFGNGHSPVVGVLRLNHLIVITWIDQVALLDRSAMRWLMHFAHHSREGQV